MEKNEIIEKIKERNDFAQKAHNVYQQTLGQIQLLQGLYKEIEDKEKKDKESKPEVQKPKKENKK